MRYIFIYYFSSSCLFAASVGKLKSDSLVDAMRESFILDNHTILIMLYILFAVYTIFWYRKVLLEYNDPIVSPQFLPLDFGKELSIVEIRQIQYNIWGAKSTDILEAIDKMVSKGYIEKYIDGVRLKIKDTDDLPAIDRRILYLLFKDKDKLTYSDIRRAENREKLRKSLSRLAYDDTKSQLVEKGYMRDKFEIKYLSKKYKKVFLFAIPLFIYFIYISINTENDGIRGGIISSIVIPFSVFFFLSIFYSNPDKRNSPLDDIDGIFKYFSIPSFFIILLAIYLTLNLEGLMTYLGIVVTLAYSILYSVSFKNALTYQGLEIRDKILGREEYIKRVEIENVDVLSKLG